MIEIVDMSVGVSASAQTVAGAELSATAAPFTPRFSILTEEQKTLMKRNLLCVSIFQMPGLDEFPELHVASVDSPSGVEKLVVLSDASNLEVLEEELKGAL